MIKKFQFVLLLVLLTIFATDSIAQDYRKGIGVIWGGRSNSGVTFKMFPSTLGERNNDAVELIYNSLHKGFILFALYERHNNIYPLGDEVDGFNWFFGAGGHAGTFVINGTLCSLDSYAKNIRISKVGLDAVLGVEFELDHSFPKHDVPLVVGLSFKPTIDFLNSQCGGNWIVQMSLRYVWG